eukprot:10811099-Alexandrium_andersonii.AAC.1
MPRHHAQGCVQEARRNAFAEGEAVRASPRLVSASMSASWPRAVARHCRLLPRRGRKGSRQVPAVL